MVALLKAAKVGGQGESRWLEGDGLGFYGVLGLRLHLGYELVGQGQMGKNWAL